MEENKMLMLSCRNCFYSQVSFSHNRVYCKKADMTMLPIDLANDCECYRERAYIRI